MGWLLCSNKQVLCFILYVWQVLTCSLKKENLGQLGFYDKLSRWKIHTVMSICNACASKNIWGTCDLFFNHLRFNKYYSMINLKKSRGNLFLWILVEQQKHIISKGAIRNNSKTTSYWSMYTVNILNYKGKKKQHGEKLIQISVDILGNDFMNVK